LHQELTEWTPDLSEAEKIDDPIDRELKIQGIKFPAVSDKVLVLSIGTNRVRMQVWLTQEYRRSITHIFDMVGAVMVLTSRLVESR